MYTLDTKISSVINDPAFGTYGHLIFPSDHYYYSGTALKDLKLFWYDHIDPDKTVEICNYLKYHADNGETIFYDIYTKEEKEKDPSKNDTGLFFFRGAPQQEFAVCSAGGGFSYVGAMHDSFPHALEISKHGYNAFALIYRPNAFYACEDLARAIRFIFEHADTLKVSVKSYSLWGGSAGGRMTAYLGTYGTASFGEKAFPKPKTLVIQYTGHHEIGKNDPPTFSCVGKNDRIANWRVMERRANAMASLHIPVEFHAYEGLEHGFGLGSGTIAEGWISKAIAFWEKNM